MTMTSAKQPKLTLGRKLQPYSHFIKQTFPKKMEELCKNDAHENRNVYNTMVIASALDCLETRINVLAVSVPN